MHWHSDNLNDDASRGGDWDPQPTTPVFDLNSTDPLPETPTAVRPTVAQDSALAPPPPSAPMRRPIERDEEGGLWLNGDVLMCPCPDCQAPMTIRLWLMLADCWQCGTTIELTEQQEQAARRLLERAASAATGAAAAEAAPPSPQPQTPQPSPAPNSVDGPAEAKPSTTDQDSADGQGELVEVAPPPPPTAPRPARRRRRRRRVVRPQAASGAAWLRGLFRDTPAWLVSLVFHLVLLTLLGIWHLTSQQEDRYIMLTTAIASDRREGGDTFEMNPDDELVFDLPTPELDPRDRRKNRDAMIRADQDARELRIDPETRDPNLAPLEVVKADISRAGEMRRALAARDPRVRVEMVKKEGGTTLTEAAVARGLRWLSMHQQPDGSWSLHRFHRRRGCNCSGSGIPCDSAGTSLALFPFLGAGQTHLVGRYRDTVSGGLRWLIENQKADGDLRAGSTGNSGMYAHGQATIVLCEAYLMTGDEQLKDPAQRAVDFIVDAQHEGGGWRYHPGQAGDTSVLGWQLMALQSARAAGLAVPEETFGLANNYLDTVARNGGSLYSYQPRQGPTAPMTAEALLCRMYLGWRRDDPGVREGVEWLLDEHMPSKRDVNIYYWYYGTQTMHHFGGKQWDRWNFRMREILVESQRRDGHAAGSWDPRGPHAGAGGRIYMTALAVCSLEVYYRHLPIFRQIDLDAAE